MIEGPNRTVLDPPKRHQLLASFVYLSHHFNHWLLLEPQIRFRKSFLHMVDRLGGDGGIRTRVLNSSLWLSVKSNAHRIPIVESSKQYLLLLLNCTEFISLVCACSVLVQARTKSDKLLCVLHNFALFNQFSRSLVIVLIRCNT